ncbi:hypothetical protein OG345_42505 [Streptomyces sp. NBC_01220]|uniref:hypothetical protein n=1 Tax=Streptomyces sp. NBC_01220 TaxID=2903781 RepID=UPI00352C2DEF|nr:hypothetical protein OG345_42505 [Streptomyces sp. NBC_01220]
MMISLMRRGLPALALTALPLLATTGPANALTGTPVDEQPSPRTPRHRPPPAHPAPG